jgi:hypothetical protein
MGKVDAERHLRERSEEVVREIGVLLLVFAPIDLVLSADTQPRRTSMLILALLGAFLLGAALIAEYRRIRGD